MDSGLFLRKDRQFINMKNELSFYWTSLQLDTDRNAILKTVEEEVVIRLVREEQTACIDQLTGGLSRLPDKSDQRESNKQIMRMFLHN